jgi:hypothetical protein
VSLVVRGDRELGVALRVLAVLGERASAQLNAAPGRRHVAERGLVPVVTHSSKMTLSSTATWQASV